MRLNNTLIISSNITRNHAMESMESLVKTPPPLPSLTPITPSLLQILFRLHPYKADIPGQPIFFIYISTEIEREDDNILILR